MKNEFPDWLVKKVAGFRVGEWLALFTFYFFSGMAYYLAIRFTSNAEFDYWKNASLDYGLKLIFTGFFWFIVFRLMKNVALIWRLSVHVVFAPMFAFSWRFVYYQCSEFLQIGHLTGASEGWDIYIPILFYVLQFGIFHVYESYRLMIAQQRTEAELRESMLKSELAVLRAQLNPHFLYNAFNAINATLPPSEEHARELIAELSDMFRYVLSAMRRDLVPMREELEFVQKYLDLEQARFGERLVYRLEVAPELMDMLLPPLLVQPLIENAVKHGISPKLEGGEVVLRIFRENGRVSVEIADNGVGFGYTHPATKGEGVGLDNTRLRLEKMYGEPLKIGENSPSGSRVSFTLPLVKA